MRLGSGVIDQLLPRYEHGSKHFRASVKKAAMAVEILERDLKKPLSELWAATSRTMSKSVEYFSAPESRNATSIIWSQPPVSCISIVPVSWTTPPGTSDAAGAGREHRTALTARWSAPAHGSSNEPPMSKGS